jgi:endonuclease V-like protein UPF0215 family
MKKQIRILGIDDGPFTFKDTHSILIGTVMRGREYLECILRNYITIDGTDATDVCIDMILHTRYKNQLKAIMIDGVTLGGFNVIDINHIFQITGIPVITITRDKPDFIKISKALQKHFHDWKQRLTLLKQGQIHKVSTSYNSIYIKCIGLPLKDAEDIIKISTIRGVIPEPLRIAHLIASGISRGESYGKA